MSNITIYTTAYCPYCVQAKRLLNSKSINFEEIAVDNDPQKRAEMMQKSRRNTVPQIFNNEQHIGDCSEIFGFERDGSLDGLLA